MHNKDEFFFKDKTLFNYHISPLPVVLNSTITKTITLIDDSELLLCSSFENPRVLVLVVLGTIWHWCRNRCITVLTTI